MRPDSPRDFGAIQIIYLLTYWCLQVSHFHCNPVLLSPRKLLVLVLEPAHKSLNTTHSRTHHMCMMWHRRHINLTQVNLGPPTRHARRVNIRYFFERCKAHIAVKWFSGYGMLLADLKYHKTCRKRHLWASTCVYIVSPLIALLSSHVMNAQGISS